MEKVSNSNDFVEVVVDDEYDAIVVGSGYGGSVAGCRMSMAGLKVCLLEKGRRWEAQDFPTDSLKLFSSVRMENRNLGIDFGPKDALFQIHIQDDSLAATACGLGGGSLVNAGVMLPTPVRARRNPKWPKAWEKDWEKHEASASNMLKTQPIPKKYQNAKILEQVIDQDFDTNHHDQLRLSVNFDIEQVSDTTRPQETNGSCLACGNCLSGCPYNAKNSTDRNYLASAIQEGCTIKTGCEVQYVIRNEFDMYKDGQGLKKRSQRRWRVFLNEFDYVAADIVVLSAGVMGTARILFQSEMRGLQVSKKLGSGLSCNGSNVAYLAGSSAPLNATGLNRKQFSSIPIQERPGPSISSAFTSSLGFTIQSAVIPAAYPQFLFKGITTYGWPYGFSFTLDIIERLRNLAGSKSSQDMVLNVMGHDESNGKLEFVKDTNRILFHPPNDPLLPKKIESLQKLAKKLGGNLFMSKYRSTSVHLLGGCNASSDVTSGVCNPDGQVFDGTSPNGVHSGLYVCDASIIPCSIGINPCLTIAAAAEHVSGNLVKDATIFFENRSRNFGSITNGKKIKNRSSDHVLAQETMRGLVGGLPCTAYLKLRFKTSQFDERNNNVAFGKSHVFLLGEVSGHIVCKSIEMEKMYIIHGEVDLCTTDNKTPYTQYMQYQLLLGTSSGSRYILEGKKIMSPYLLALYTWRESTTLNVTLRKINKNVLGEDKVDLKGQLHISPLELVKTMWSLQGGRRSKFVYLLTLSLIRTYILQIPRESHHNFTPMEIVRGPYPNSTIHEIKSEDGFTISCQHWEPSHNSREFKQERKPYPVLLINGYATESYYLPTETNDLVRTLLKEGHDVWLLHSRIHQPNPPNVFSIEDIGRSDVPAAIDKIIKFYGEPTRIHVIAHCIGGLAIHIALMGGYISAKKIASLSCTNSSMFFKVTTSSLVKMWLPLVPMSMAILGKNKTLPMLQTLTSSFRQRLLKSIARFLPRCERCTCDECEVFSGIFGNAFWHENISHTMHYWMNKEYLPRLPMAAFPHLRKICNAGFIVDSNGKNAYMIHPERMTVPTLYISGGRTLLVTPETTFLANKYMKLHQPCFRHERVVVEGFGHSDLLIGEKSHEKVFPHIQKHIELSEEDLSSGMSSNIKTYNKEVLEWKADPYYEDKGSFGSWVLVLIFILLLVMIFKLFIF